MPKVMGLIRQEMGVDAKIKTVLTFMNQWISEVADGQSRQMIRLQRH